MKEKNLDGGLLLSGLAEARVDRELEAARVVAGEEGRQHAGRAGLEDLHRPVAVPALPGAVEGDDQRAPRYCQIGSSTDLFL